MCVHCFAMALSYAGEQRPFIGEVAGRFGAAFPQTRLFYDAYHDAEFARIDLDACLPKFSSKQSELIVIFLSSTYRLASPAPPSPSPVPRQRQ